MNKLLLTLLCTSVLFGAKYETYSKYQTSVAEKSKIQGYQKILSSLEDGEELSKIINNKTYFDNLDNYFSSNISDLKLNRYLKTLSNPLLKRINKNISSNFSYKENSVEYVNYLKSFKNNLPKRKRMELARDIVLESSEVYLFMQIVRENIPESLLAEKSTFQKNNYFEKIKKKALKYYILRTLFVTKDFSIEEMGKLLSFLQSSEYTKLKEFKTKYTKAGFLNDNVSEKTKIDKISKEVVDETRKKLKKEADEERNILKKLVKKDEKISNDGKKRVMTQKEIIEFKNKQKEIEYSKKIKAAQAKAQEEGIDPLIFDPLSIDDE